MGDKVFTSVYVILSLVAIIADIYTALRCTRIKRKASSWLMITCIGAALVQSLYLVSVFADNKSIMSIAMSGYFASVSITVVAFFTFFRLYVRKSFGKREIISFWVMIGWLALDFVTLLINPFKEIVVKYYDNGQKIASYSYEMLPLFWLHLACIYILLLVTFVNIYKGAIRVPKAYRSPFIRSIWVIIAVIVINAAYLYFPSAFGGNALDYSLWGYSIAAMMIYENCYVYAVDGMKPFYNLLIVENVNQGVALFNYDDKLTIINEKLNKLIPHLEHSDSMPIDVFLKQLDLDLKPERKNDDYSLQFYTKHEGKNTSIRLDHRCLRGDDGEFLGQLLVFTDEVGDIDVLTSFYNWETFKANQSELIIDKNEPIIVAVCDINGLGDINNEYGRLVGDRAISILAQSIRKTFPKESHFLRGQEAGLIVITHGISVNEVNSALTMIQTEVGQQEDVPCFINIQTAISVMKPDEELLDTIKLAFKSLKNKKLLDVKSPKSELVKSLVKALEEVDFETEEHVKRTQTMGYELGRRLGLSDIQLSDLALLCILHDIGKIGIPLNILNKPSKLNDAEWQVMKSHTEKGYQIAMSAKELSDIADMILHHHECWDGRGYPDGLSKESIPLLSRLISVVDAYDAMVNDRPYRKGLSQEQAIAELRRCAGTQFDPAIVNEFIELLPEVNSDTVRDDNIVMSAQVFLPDDGNKDEADTSNVHPVEYSRYWLDSKMVIVEVNDAFEKLTGYTKEDIANMKITQNDLLPEEDKIGYAMLVNEQLSHSSMAFFEHRIICKNGAIKRVMCMGRIYFDAAMNENRSEIIVVDSTSTHAMKAIVAEEHIKAQTKLQRWENKYRTDSLTGILNHEAFRSEIDMTLVEGSKKVMFIMLDVDHFKQFNDTHGHKAGDEFLIMVAQTLEDSLRSDDLACRMGGDEFACALIYSPTTDDDVMLKRAKQIFEKLNYIMAEGGSGTNVSAGVAISSSANNTFNKLYEAADKALYKAKETGRARLITAE